MHFLVISGRSGSGKTSALHLLEDEGYTCIDNIPVSLLPALVEQVKQPLRQTANEQKFAIGIDARNLDSDLGRFPEILASANLTPDEYRILFLDTTRDVLLKRYSETRRRHPLSDEQTGLPEALEKEQAILSPMADLADTCLDTSRLSLHELRSAVKQLVVGTNTKGVALTFSSFGFKYGVPIDADFVFDVRCLPNPHWEPSLRAKTGLEGPVIEFLDAQMPVQEMYSDIANFVQKWVPAFEDNNRSYLTIAVGCTGGMHRSVYLCEKLANSLKSEFKNVQSRHRQLKSSTS